MLSRYNKLLVGLGLMSMASCAHRTEQVARPKLVVGIVVDQMRWDYLYRYYPRYSHDGFRRLISDGFNCQQTMLSYIPAYTAPGHTCIYTGSVPSIHGIAGNNWIDNRTGRNWYCVDDDAVTEANDTAHSFSPRNLLVSTVTDELRLATNFHSRVFGVAIKDRGSILPAGHAANAAYWYNDKTGNFVTSTYYDKKYWSPDWLKTFNDNGNRADNLAKQNWELLDNIAAYTQSTSDTNGFEDVFKGESLPVFPHKVSMLSRPDRLGALKTMPAGNTLTLDMAKACIAGEKLGGGDFTDFLCVSLSSTDYTGHQFGPNSVEAEDMFVRLDGELASFFKYLDETVGRGNYLLFLTADHGAAHNPQYLLSKNIPAGIWHNASADLNSYLQEQFKSPVPLVTAIANYQVFFNDTFLIGNKSFNRDQIKASAIDWLTNVMPKRYNVPVQYVMDMNDLNKTAVPEPIRQMAVNGYYHNRSGSVLIILNPGWFDSDRFTGTTHGSWNPYDTHIPLLWYGWHVPRGESHTEVHMTDIAPTVAALLHIQMPNGCVGKPITDLIK